MPDSTPSTKVFDRGFQLMRLVQAAANETQAHEILAETARDYVNATRVHVFVLDAAGKPEHRASHPASAAAHAEHPECLAEIDAALARHRKRHDPSATADAVNALPETDESIPLSVVAKVLADHDVVLAVAVIVREGGARFTEQQRSYFTVLCSNAASGLVRRRPRRLLQTVSASADAVFEHPKTVADAVMKVKTRRLTVPRARFAEPLGGLLGRSPQIAEVRELIHRFAPEHFAVLLLGETGTGKELAARALHDLSPRKDKPFRAIN